MTALGNDRAAGLRFRLLESDDAEEVYDTHKAIVQRLQDSTYMYERELSFFELLLNTTGYIIGAFSDSSLVAYMAFTRPGVSNANHARYLRGLGIKQEDVSEGSGSGVSLGFRNQGVFRELLHMRSRVLDKIGCLSTAVVARQNLPALKATLDEQFMLAGILHDQDGPNYLLVRPPDGKRKFKNPPIEISSIQNEKRNISLLEAESIVGVKGTSQNFQPLKFYRWNWDQS